MSLIVHFFTLAGMYLTLQAQFIAIIQILVYAGAIMVLVVFVIMLLNLGKEENMHEKFNLRTTMSLAMAALLVVQFLTVFLGKPTGMNALPEKSFRWVRLRVSVRCYLQNISFLLKQFPYCCLQQLSAQYSLPSVKVNLHKSF